MKILAIHCGALGDVILFARLLDGLDGSVTLVAGGEKARLMVGLGAVDAALDFDSLPMHEVFADVDPDGDVLPGLLGKHDRLISCFVAGDRKAELRLATLCRTADASFLPIRPDENYSEHLIELWADMLGMDHSARNIRPWTVPNGWRDEARRMLTFEGVNPACEYVVIHPGSGSPQKCWPMERFIEVGQMIARHGRAVVFCLGPVELDRWPEADIRRLDGEFATVKSPSLVAFAGLLSSAVAYVGNDSGMSHLSAAVGAPSVALFGPTRAEHFAPLGSAVCVIQADRLTDISPAEVVAAVDQS